MALINCPECGKEISDKALACPSCGCPIGGTGHVKLNKTKNIVIIAILFVFVCGLIFVFASGKSFLFSFTGKKEVFSEDVKKIEKVDKSVVKIICYDYFGEELATGSGFVAFDKNTIVTNFHVIEGADSVAVQISEEKIVSIEYAVCSSEEKDLAILKTKLDLGIEPLKLGSSDNMSKGEEVVAIGSPLGLVNTVSTGVISGRTKENGGEVIQFTAPISNGSSGGALFDSKGMVIGVTYASYVDGQNLNLAIPIEQVIKLYAEKKEENYTSFAKKMFPELELFSQYEEIYQVTFSDLKNSPNTYNKKYVVFYAYVSSFGDSAGLSLTNDKEYISGDNKFDYNYMNQTSWHGCPYLMGVTTPVSKGYDCKSETGSLVMVIGKFSYIKDEDDAIIWVEYYK